MATIYVNSAAVGTNAGTSWANAYTSIASTTGAAAGDVILVASGHVQAQLTVSTTLDWANGTALNPVRIISASTADSSYLRGAQVCTLTHASSYDLTWNGNLWMAGLHFYGTAAGSDILFGSGEIRRMWDCSLNIAATVQAVGASETTIWNANGQTIACSYIWISAYNTSITEIRNATITCSSGSYLFRNYGDYHQLRLDDCDLSGSSSAALCYGEAQGSVITLNRCKLKASWTGSTVLARDQTLTLTSCDDGTTTTPVLGMSYHETQFGSIVADSGRYRTSGASDGTTAYSFAMTSNSSAVEWYFPLESRPISRWVGTGSQTVTVYVASGVTLENDEFWIEVSSPSEAGSATAQGKFQTTRAAALATPAALTTDSGSTWNGSGVGTKQKCSVTINPTVAGTMTVRVFLAKPSTTVYVDAKLDVA